MEKAMSFSVFKEKIIKTNELLGVVLERNQALEKSQKWIQHLKTKLELSKNEINKLKQRNETLTYNLTSAEKNYDALTDEHDKLKVKFNQLENESNNTINNLQVKYQHANQELRECEEKMMLNELEPEESFLANDPTSPKRKPAVKRKKSPVKKKECPEIQFDSVMVKKLNQLQKEKETHFNEKTELQLEIYELKKKYNNLKSCEDSLNKEEHNKMKEDLQELKKDVEAKAQEIGRLSKEIKKLENQKDKFQADNEKLTAQNSLFQHEISKLKQKCVKNKEEFDKLKKQGFSEEECKLTATIELKNKEINKLEKEVENVERQNNSLNLENKKLKDENCTYKIEISMLQESSCLSKEKLSNIEHNTDGCFLETCENNANNENVQIENKEISKTPPHAHLRKDSLTPTDEEICVIMRQMVVPPEVTPIIEEASNEERNFSPDEDNVDLCPSPVFLKNNNKEVPPANINLREIVNKRRKYIKKKRQIAKGKRNQVDLYGALLALKRANIDFIISSNTLLPPVVNSTRSTNFHHFKRNKFKQIEKRKPAAITTELKCSLPCCNNTYMVLKECSDDEDSSLLGFVGVKNESSTIETHVNNFIVANPTTLLTNNNKSIDSAVEKSVKKRKTLINNTSAIGSEFVLEKTNTIVNIHDQNTETENDTTACAKKRNDCSQSINGNERLKRICDPSGMNSDGSPTANKSSVEFIRKRTCDQPLVVRKSKRNTLRKSFASMIKKKRNEGKSKSAITECLDAYINEEDNTLCRNPPTTPTRLELSFNTKPVNDDAIGSNNTKPEDFIFKKPATSVKSPRAVFKRPVCSTRRSQRLASVKEQCEKNIDEVQHEEKREEHVPLESPKSPTPDREESSSDKPVIIPLEKVCKSGEKLPTSKIEMLFSKLILYSEEEEALNEVVREFSSQEPEYVAEAILERISVDCHDKADTKYHPAPLMTHAQRTMLGFMSKLEKTCMSDIFDTYLPLAEQRLLTCDNLLELGPITRLYLAVCKFKKQLTRMRKMCCDVFYFCGDLAVPFLFTVLTSWTEVLPHANDAKDFPLARVLVQIVYTRNCKPGHNLMPLRDLLIKFYGYPSERWDNDEFFKELLNEYLRKPSRLTDFPIILYCRSQPEKWVYEKIEEHLKPMVSLGIQDNFKATLVILIGNLYNRFSSKSEINYLPRIREWLLSLITDETAEVVKRCIYVSLNRLKKK